MSRPRRSPAFFERKWYLGIAALVALTAGVIGIISGTIPLFRSSPVFENAEIIVDSSQAMATELFDGVPKLQAAAQAVQNVMTNEGLQRNNLALREVGGACGSVPPKPTLDFSTSNERKIRSRMSALTASGSANLVDTLLQAITDFEDIARFKDVSKRIIVITGNPDACGRDVEAAKQRIERLKKAGHDISVDFHFIGLGLNADGVNALNNLAETTGGSTDFPQTRDDLQKVMHRIVEVEPVFRSADAVTKILNANIHAINDVTSAADNVQAKERQRIARAAFETSEVPFRDLGKRQTTPAFKSIYEAAARQHDRQKQMLDESEAIVADPKNNERIKSFNENAVAFNAEAAKLNEQLRTVATAH
jgi:hypothetical protein